MSTSDAILSPHEVRRLAVAGYTHPRTVERFYRGEPVRSTTAARIREAARELGLPLPPHAEEEAQP